MKTYGIDLSKEIEIPSLSDFTNRATYNAWKNKASSFTNRNNARYQFRKNKNGLVASVSQINEWNRLSTIERNIAKKKQKEYANKPFMRHGQQIGTIGDRFGMLKRPKNIGFSVPPKFDFNNYHSKEALERRIKVMEGRTQTGEFDNRLRAFRERYLYGIKETFNGDEETQAIYDKLEALPADVLYNLYLENDELQVLFNPSPDKGVTHGVTLVDEQEHRDTLFEVEKIIDLEMRGKHDILRDFPHKW
jgi:hypothetical protein